MTEKGTAEYTSRKPNDFAYNFCLFRDIAEPLLCVFTDGVIRFFCVLAVEHVRAVLVKRAKMDRLLVK